MYQQQDFQKGLFFLPFNFRKDFCVHKDEPCDTVGEYMNETKKMIINPLRCRISDTELRLRIIVVQNQILVVDEGNIDSWELIYWKFDGLKCAARLSTTVQLQYNLQVVAGACLVTTDPWATEITSRKMATLESGLWFLYPIEGLSQPKPYSPQAPPAKSPGISQPRISNHRINAATLWIFLVLSLSAKFFYPSDHFPQTLFFKP